MTIKYRIARADDVSHIVPLIEMAAGGITDFLLKDLVEGTTPAELIEIGLYGENTPYHFSNIMVAEEKSQLVAASNFYPAEQHDIPDFLKSFILKERLAIIKPYLQTRVPDSMYIHTMATLPAYRKRTVALGLFSSIQTLAKKSGAHCISAHVWRDNKPVFKALKAIQFKEVAAVDIAYHPDLPHQGGMVLLKGPDF